ncbi:hypothetical protein PAP_06455 [Palaeococcus pacificus DY20341]|uniref:Uncharacterized protein n=1 Tax=Palaeococcus pacificus DY20341 TaxID=1343739 RepID=A0A075LYN5_9EURY|nr:hypothetical protein [Palaeococcus pacificus]AIF69688.1 hypothetical protein PAP_06455 [Palaeococcus pacificus DY20341]
MKKLLAVISVLLIVGAVLAWNYVGDKEVITLRATFRMGGVSYKGYEMRGDTLIFKFERKGDVFIQVITQKEVTERIKGSPSRVLMEVSTNGRAEVYEARLVEEDGERKIYEASEL